MTIQAMIDNPEITIGYKLLPDHTMTESQLQHINRSWFMHIVASILHMKKVREVQVPSTKFFMVHDCIIAHPKQIEKIKRARAKVKICQ